MIKRKNELIKLFQNNFYNTGTRSIKISNACNIIWQSIP